MATRILLHVPYLSSLRNFVQSGFLDFVVERDHLLTLIAPTRERRDLDAFLARWPARVDFVPQEPLFPEDFGTRLRRRWRLLLHGLSLELLRNKNVTFRRQADRHSLPVRLFCRTAVVKPLLRRLYPYLDYLVPASPRMLAVVREAKPDVVAAVACLADTVEIDVFRVARALGIPSAMIIHSWDNPAGRGAPPIRPDRWIVWGEEMRGHVMRYYGASPNATEITGPVQLSMYSDETLALCDRASFLKEIGLDPNREIILYAPTQWYPGYSDMSVLALLAEYADCHEEVQIWFRPHPHSRELRQTIPFARENGVFVDPRFLAFVADGLHDKRYMPSLDFYPHMLNATDVIVSNMSTLALEATLVGRPLTIVGFDCPAEGTPVIVPMREVLQHPPTTPLLAEDAVVVAWSREEFLRSLDRARWIRFSNAPALERLRSCANRIATVRDGKVFERLLRAVTSLCRESHEDNQPTPLQLPKT